MFTYCKLDRVISSNQLHRLQVKPHSARHLWSFMYYIFYKTTYKVHTASVQPDFSQLPSVAHACLQTPKPTNQSIPILAPRVPGISKAYIQILGQFLAKFQLLPSQFKSLSKFQKQIKQDASKQILNDFAWYTTNSTQLDHICAYLLGHCRH